MKVAFPQTKEWKLMQFHSFLDGKLRGDKLPSFSLWLKTESAAFSLVYGKFLMGCNCGKIYKLYHLTFDDLYSVSIF